MGEDDPENLRGSLGGFGKGFKERLERINNFLKSGG